MKNHGFIRINVFDSIFQHEVSELEGKMSLTSRMENCGMPPYLILDSQALCRHLSLIRSLSKSREFIMIVPIQGKLIFIVFLNLYVLAVNYFIDSM